MKRFLCLFSFLLFFMFVSASPVDFIVVTPGWENVFSNSILFTNKNGYEIFVDENFQYDASDFSLEKEGTVISNGATFDVVVHPTLGRKGRLKFLVNSYPTYKDTVNIVYNSNVVTSFESPDTTIKDATLDCGDGLIDGSRNKIIHFTNDEWEDTLSDYSCDFPYRDKLGWYKGETKIENYSEVEDGDTLTQKYNAQPVTDNITYVMKVPYASRGKIFEFTNDDVYEKIYPEGEDASYTPFITFTDKDITSESENETVYTKTVTRTSQVELDTPEAITKDGQKGRTYKILGSYYSTTLKKVLDENTGLYSFAINEEKQGDVTINGNDIKFEVAWNYSPYNPLSVSYANMKVFDQFNYSDIVNYYSNYPSFKLSKFYYDKNETQLATVRNDNYSGLIRTSTENLTHYTYCESVEHPAILLYAHYDSVPSPSIKVTYNSDDSTFTITSDDDTYLSKIKKVTLGSCSLGDTKFYTNGSLDFSKVQTFFEVIYPSRQLFKLASAVYKIKDETFYPLDAHNILKISAEGYDDFIQEFNLADKTPIIEITSDEENFYITSEPADWIEKHWPEDFTTSSGKTGHRFEEVVSPGMRTVNLKTLASKNNLLNLNNESINTISFEIHGKIKQYPVSIKLPYIEKAKDFGFKIGNEEGRVYFYISSSDTEYINRLVNDKKSIVEYNTGDIPTEEYKNDSLINSNIHVIIPLRAIDPVLENPNTAKYDITNTDKFFSFGTNNEVTIKVDGYADENRHLIDIPYALNETPLDLKVEWKANGDLEISFTDDKYANTNKNIAIRFFDGYIDASGNAVSEPVRLGSPYTGFKKLGVSNFVDGWDDGYSISKNGAKTVITISGAEFSKFKSGKQYVVQIGSAGYNTYYSKATYTSPTWKISFDLKDGKWEEGNSEKTVGVQNFGKIGKLPIPVRDGYVFAGWFLNEDTEVKEGDTYSFGKNITVYAKWKATYNLTYKFISSSGKQLMEDYTLTPVVGETINVSPATISGYKNLPTKQENVLPNGDKTITYVYTPEEYSITYNLDGGKLSGQRTSYNIESADYLLPTPTKEGNSFEGWYMTGLSVPIKMIGIGSTGNIDLTAKWKTINTPIVVPPKDDPKPETETKYVYISYVLNGALSNPNPDKVAQGEIINLQSLKRAGYDFQGWTDAQNNLVSTLKADKDIILIANWEPIEYTYTLVSDKGETLKTEKYTIEDEITFAKPSSILDEEYIGWYENGNPDRLITGIKKGTTGNKTYYLKIAKACVIKFVSEHGSTPEDLLIKKGERNISLPLLAEEGYEFNGWYSDRGLNVAVGSIDSENCENMTLYAGWIEVPIPEEEKVEATSPLPTTTQKSFWETFKDILLKSAIVGAVIGALAGLGALAYNFIKANLFAIKKAFKKPKLPTKVIVMELKEVDKYKKLITLMNSKKFLKVYLADKDNIFDEIQERNPDLVLMDVFDDETITNYGLLKSNEIFTNSEAKLDIITENGDSFEEDTFSPDSTPGELMSQMVTPLYKDALKEDDSLEYIANVVEALGVPGVPQVIKLYVKGKDIKANFDGDEFSLFEATNVVGDIADILGFEEVEEATDFIKTTKAVADTVRKEKGANAIKDALNMME